MSRMEDRELRDYVLGAKKSERAIFVTTPEIKAALQTIASRKWTTVSALLTLFALNEVIVNKELFDGSV